MDRQCCPSLVDEDCEKEFQPGIPSPEASVVFAFRSALDLFVAIARGASPAMPKNQDLVPIRPHR